MRTAKKPINKKILSRMDEFAKSLFSAYTDGYEDFLNNFHSLCVTKKFSSSNLLKYHQALLFLLAYPMNKAVREMAEKELLRILQLVSKDKSGVFDDSGLSGSKVAAAFSLSLTEWFLKRHAGEIRLLENQVNASNLQQMLTSAFHVIDQEVLSEQQLSFAEWKKKYILSSGMLPLEAYILLTRKLEASFDLQEKIFEHFLCYTSWKMPINAQNISSGRVELLPIHYHEKGLEKKAIPLEVFSQGAPTQIKLTSLEKQRLCDLAKGVLASMQRETDPFTYANENETSYYDMGRGIGIALFYMRSEKKLSIETYAGFLLIKNHVPLAYGGGWVFGHQSRFGMNIFPAFRGGESVMVFLQLVRCYAYAFRVKQFVIDPYQLGKGNSDGIKSGAFWFYYKLGFRPRQNDLKKTAAEEFKKLQANKQFRSSKQMLESLANAHMMRESPFDESWNYIDFDNVKMSNSIVKTEHKTTSSEEAFVYFVEQFVLKRDLNKKEVEQFRKVYKTKVVNEREFVLGFQGWLCNLA